MPCLSLPLLVRFGFMNRQFVESPLANPSILPLSPVTTIAADTVLVVAPHPDDETLGCGGAIALLRSLGCAVRVLVISDGTMSHPRSRKYPANALRTLREAETQAATAVLGVEPSEVMFLRLKDGEIPTIESPKFREAIARCQEYLSAFAPPNIIFLPWRHDPHPDHRATWQLIHTVLVSIPYTPRLIEYPIWDWDPEQRSSLPNPEQVSLWRLDICEVVALKQQAIATYRSQTTNLIDDDPEGFCLTPEMLANFTRPWEVYLEENNESTPKAISTTKLF